MQVGQCKQCLETRELCDSHYIPRRAYSQCIARANIFLSLATVSIDWEPDTITKRGG